MYCSKRDVYPYIQTDLSVYVRNDLSRYIYSLEFSGYFRKTGKSFEIEKCVKMVEPQH